MTALRASLRSLTHRVAREDEGASAVEYGLLVGLIAVAIIVTVGILGTTLDGLFQTVVDAMPGGTP